MNRITISPRIRTTPFHESTVAAGATDITVYNKMVLPLSFGDLEAEYDRLINGVAIWDVAVERQVQISGPDAHVAAQYFTSRDITNMVEGQGKYVAMCNHDGHILNDPVLMKLSGGRYWFSIADNDMLLWCKGIAAERGWDVEVTEPDVSPLAVQGPKAEDLIAELVGEHVRDIRLLRFIEADLDGIGSGVGDGTNNVGPVRGEPGGHIGDQQLGTGVPLLPQPGLKGADGSGGIDDRCW